jgi:hypothetical protein
MIHTGQKFVLDPRRLSFSRRSIVLHLKLAVSLLLQATSIQTQQEHHELQRTRCNCGAKAPPAMAMRRTPPPPAPPAGWEGRRHFSCIFDP